MVSSAAQEKHHETGYENSRIAASGTLNRGSKDLPRRSLARLRRHRPLHPNHHHAFLIPDDRILIALTPLHPALDPEHGHLAHSLAAPELQDLGELVRVVLERVVGGFLARGRDGSGVEGVAADVAQVGDGDVVDAVLDPQGGDEALEALCWAFEGLVVQCAVGEGVHVGDLRRQPGAGLHGGRWGWEDGGGLGVGLAACAKSFELFLQLIFLESFAVSLLRVLVPCVLLLGDRFNVFEFFEQAIKPGLQILELGLRRLGLSLQSVNPGLQVFGRRLRFLGLILQIVEPGLQIVEPGLRFLEFPTAVLLRRW